MAAARQAELESIQTMKQELDSMRQELADLTARAAAAEEAAEEPAAEPAAEGEEAGEPAPTAEEFQVQAEQMGAEVEEKADEFLSTLVSFINADPPLVGAEPTETQLAAIRMKSDEDIILAQDYIDEGGDYKRAIRIYEDALVADPGNEKLEAALEEAQALRFMTVERFGEVKKGMSRDEVRGLLGQVNLRNIREYPDRDIVAWFYPTAEDGSAAGVFFRKDERSDEFVVYQTKFEAVQPKTGEE